MQLFRNKIFLFFSILSGIALSHALLSQNTYAVDYSTIQNKWMYTQYYQCLKSSNTESSITKISGSGKVLNSVFKNSGTMYMPSYGLSGVESLSCLGVATGKSGLTGNLSSGVLGSYKNVTWDNKTASEQLMTDVLKYKKLENTTSFSGSFQIKATKTVTENYGVFNDHSSTTESTTDSADITVSPLPEGGTHYGGGGWTKNLFKDIKISWNNYNNKTDEIVISVASPTGCYLKQGYSSIEETFPLKANPNELYNDIQRKLANRSVAYHCEVGGGNNSNRSRDIVFSFGMGENNIVDSTTATGYEKLDSTARSSVYEVSPYFMMSGSSGNGSGDLRFSPTEYYNLYSYYLSKTAERYGGSMNALTCNPSSTSNLTPVKLLDDTGTAKQCYVNFNGTDPSTVIVYTQGYSDGAVNITTISMQGVLDWMNNANNLANVNVDEVNSSDDLDTGQITNPGNSSSDETEGDAPSCFKSTGALGWLMCPVTEMLGGATTFLYNQIVEPFLVVDANEIMASNGGVYQGWSTFRNFANIIFVILFLIVILAQITGIGLTNYNVKKILPRLIMVAILVNISYIICQLAVDISNIIGNSLNELFSWLAGTVTVPSATGEGSYNFDLASITEGFLSIVTSGGAIVAAGAAVLTLDLWIFPFLLTLIGCIISIIFFFIILSVRQAGVILLVVIAPVAIVCYALPNTKSFFDKWKKMFTALLIVYPICGLLMGGGQYAASLLLATDGGFFYTLAAMLLCVVPFFMIPSILRSSMALMGNLGMKISNFGKGIGGGATRTIRNSEMGRNIQRQNQLDYDTRTANKLGKRIERLEAGKTGEELEKIRNSRKYRGLYRRHATHDAAARRLLSEDARAYSQTGAGPIGRGTESYANMMSAAAQEATMAETKNARASYESGTAYVTDKEGNVVTDSTGKRTRIRANDINALGAEYLNRLNELQENPTSRSALTRVRALQDMLMASDAGRTMMKSKQLEHALTYQPDYSTTDQSVDKSKFALTQASEHLLSDQHQGTIKAKNRSTWSMEQDFNKGDFSKLFGQSGITALGDGGSVLPQGSQDTPSGYGIGAYEQGGLDGYDEGSLVGADEGALQSINRTITDINNTAPDKITQSQAKQKAAITALAGSAYGKESLSTQPKVAEQLRKMIINGNTASTIQSTDVKALNRLATDIGQDTLTGEDRNHLVELAREAFKVDGGVRDAEHAAALNSILAAAKQPTIEWSGRLNTQGQADSGPVPIRTAGSQNSTANPIITASGSASIDELRRQANQNRPNNGRSGQSES